MGRQPLSSSLFTTTTHNHSTVDLESRSEELQLPEAWCLTVLYHPDLRRIGAQYRWPSEPGHRVDLSRLEPLFTPADRSQPVEPLGDSHISRSPLTLRNTADGISLTQESDRAQFEVNGRPGGAREHLGRSHLVEGVVISLGQRVSLMVHGMSGSGSSSDHGLAGVSPAIAKVRTEIERVGPLNMPVLLTGESGVGKELVARAIHRVGPRAARKLVAINMAALPASTAAAQLFGFARGAFTGAGEARAGLFGDAAGGTLFLDEIGETPSEIQPMLLRAIEAQEIQPLGLAPQRIDVRIIAATDSDLERLSNSGGFRRPLLYRLSAATLPVPALRERRVDIPVLLMHFLRAALTDLNAAHRLEPAEGRQPWLRRRDVLALVRYRWPGNVRELRNVANQIALDCHTQPVACLPARLLEQLDRPDAGVWSLERRSMPVGRPGHGESGVESPAGRTRYNLAPPFDVERTPGEAYAGSRSEETPAGQKRAPYLEPKKPSEIGAGALRESLERHDWRIGASAAHLGISRNSLYTLMEQYGIRHAGLLSPDEIRAAAQSEGTFDLDRLASRLEVSPRGLRLRMRALGLEP